MKRLFIVCGPESAGNRLVAAYLHRAGVDIDASTRPQQVQRVHSPMADVGLIIHHDPKLTEAVVAGIRAARRPQMVVLSREHRACSLSMMARGHVDDLSAAAARIRLSHMAAMDVAIRFDMDFVVVAYESLVLHPRETVAGMLAGLGLPTGNLGGEICVQRRWQSPVPVDRNADRYAA